MYSDIDFRLALSIDPEAVFNTGSTTDGDFEGVIVSGRAPQIPKIEKKDDSGKSGHGAEGITCIRNGYYKMIDTKIVDDLNANWGTKLFLRSLGGSQSTAVVAATQQHTQNQQRGSNKQLPGTTLISRIGPFDYFFPGNVVDKFSIQQNGADNPSFEADLVGTGQYASSSAAVLSAVDVCGQNYFDGSLTTVVFNDGVARTPTSDGRVRSIKFGYDNNVIRDDRRSGDPAQGTGTLIGQSDRAPYVNRIHRRKPKTSLQIGLETVNSDNELQDFLKNTAITSCIVTFKGGKIAATSIYYSLAINIPIAKIVDMGAPEGDDEYMHTLDLQPMIDPATGMDCWALATNNTASFN